MVSSTARKFAALAVLGLALAGCGGSESDDDGGGTPGGGSGNLGACVNPGGCIWYRDYPASAGAADAYSQGCTSAGGAWGDACPTADVVGICAQTSEGATMEIWYYAPNEVANVEANCAATGATFRATP